MDRMKLLVICAVTANAPFAPTAAAPSTAETAIPRLAQWQSIITEAAQQFGIPDAWIRGVMRAESGGRTRLNGKPITSPKGAMGLMQVMPGTYRALRVQYGFGDDADDPRDNIFAGAAYLRQMYDRYGYPSLFAAYNAGPKRLDDFLVHRQSLPRATLDYVGSIVPGAEIAFSNRFDAAPLPAPVQPASTQSVLHSASGKTLFFTRNDPDIRSESTAGASPVAAHSDNPTAASSSTNNAALFVPLAGSTQ